MLNTIHIKGCKPKMKNDNNWIWAIVAICAVLLISFFGFGGMMGIGYGNMMGSYGMMGGYGYGAMFLGWLMWILIIGLIIAGIYWLIKTANRK